jgi:hypothetical protein
LEGLKLVGADIVEVATPYDTNAQVTAIAAADLMYEGMLKLKRFKVQKSTKQFIYSQTPVQL